MHMTRRAERFPREGQRHGGRPSSAHRAVGLMGATLLSVSLLPAASAETPGRPGEHHDPKDHARPAVTKQAVPARRTVPMVKNADPEAIVVQSDRHRVIHPNGTLLTRSDWATALTGANPLSLLATTPGVSYVSSDAYGLDESDASLFMRGFHMNELGIMFEGIPLNDVSFTTLTGNNVNNIGVPDLIGSIYVSPGTSRESAFSSTSRGGELRYSLENPTDRANADITQSVGSNQTYVTTVTGNTGQIGAYGPKILAGFQRISKDKYEGGGTQYMIRGNVKVTQDVSWGDFSAFLAVSDAQVWGYNDLSNDMISKLGWRGSDYLYPNYPLAYYQAGAGAANACGPYLCGDRAVLIPYDSGQVSQDWLGSLRHHFNITHALSGNILFYGASTYTDASVSDPTTPSETGAPFSEQVWHSQVRRFGGTAELAYQIADHALSAGLWEESASSRAAGSWYNEPLLGEGKPLLAVGPFTSYGPAFQVENMSAWKTSSRQIYLHDDWHLRPELTLGMGFKAVDFSTTGGGIGNDDVLAPYGKLRSRNGFLPHLSLLYRPTRQDDFFVDAAQTQGAYNVFPRGNLGYGASAWTAADQSTFDEATRNIKPERDTTVTIGGHHRRGRLRISYDAYFSLIENRLIAASVGDLHAPINTVASIPASHIWGGDAAVALPVGHYLTLNQSLSVSRFSYGGDLNVGDTVFPLRGKAQPGYPAISLLSSLLFHYHQFQAGATATVYLDQQTNYQNDLRARNYFNTTAFLSYELPKHGNIPGLKFRFDVYNILNEKMIGNIGVDGFPFSGDKQTMQRAAPRQALFSIGTKF